MYQDPSLEAKWPGSYSILQRSYIITPFMIPLSAVLATAQLKEWPTAMLVGKPPCLHIIESERPARSQKRRRSQMDASIKVRVSGELFGKNKQRKKKASKQTRSCAWLP